jgi:hypothetical protein
MRHESTSSQVVHGVQLQKNHVWAMQAHCLKKDVHVSFKGHIWHSEEVHLRILAMVYTNEGEAITYWPQVEWAVWPSAGSCSSCSF